MKYSNRKGSYAVYIGDEYILGGTIEEIAKYFGVKYNTVKRWGTPTFKNRTERGRIKKTLVRTGDAEDEKIAT